MPKIRIDKIVSSASGLSRREAHDLIRSGRVTVSGTVIRDIGFKVDPDSEEVLLNGQSAGYCKNVYYMLNKPAGLLSAASDKNRRTVVDIVFEETGRKNLFPVGRLDKDTTGLLLITDDGEFAHRVISPKSHVEKEYIALLDGDVGQAEIDAFANGVELADGRVCRPAKLETDDESGQICRVTLTEGKYHQVKRMFGAVGLGVNELCRVRIGELKLDSSLAEGEFRALTEDEKKLVLKSDK